MSTFMMDVIKTFRTKHAGIQIKGHARSRFTAHFCIKASTINDTRIRTVFHGVARACL